MQDEIVNDTDFRIIHLRRENLLRRYLSQYIANNVTRVTLAIHGQTVPEIQSVVLNPHQGQKDFETIVDREREFAELFAQHPGFQISYEEMITPGSEILQSLLDFMEVPRRELTTTTQKLGCTDLRKAIANFRRTPLPFCEQSLLQIF